jgi:hypothetical protein
MLVTSMVAAVRFEKPCLERLVRKEKWYRWI